MTNTLSELAHRALDLANKAALAGDTETADNMIALVREINTEPAPPTPSNATASTGDPGLDAYADSIARTQHSGMDRSTWIDPDRTTDSPMDLAYKSLAAADAADRARIDTQWRADHPEAAELRDRVYSDAAPLVAAPGLPQPD